MAKHINQFVLIFLMFLLPQTAIRAQLRISDNRDDILRVKLGSGFMEVVKQARIDMDSTLVIASERDHLSRIPIITEGLDKNYPSANCRWMDGGNLKDVKKQLKQLTGKEHCRMQLLLGAFYAFKPGPNKSFADSALFYLKRAKLESMRLGLKDWAAQTDILLGKSYIKSGDFPAAAVAFQSAIDYAGLSKNNAIAAKAYDYQEIYYPFTPAFLPLRVDCCVKAIELYKNVGDKSNQINVLMNASYQNFAVGKLKESQALAEQSLQLQRAINFPYLHYSTDMLAFVALYKGNFAMVLQLALDEVKTAEATRDSLGLAYFYGRVGSAYYEAGSDGARNFSSERIEQSNIWSKKSLNEYKKHGGDGNLYALFTNKSFIDYALGSDNNVLPTLLNIVKNYPPTNPIDEENAYLAIGTCFQNLKNYRKAEKFFLMAVVLEASNEKIRGKINGGYAYYRLGGLYATMKEHQKNRYFTGKFLEYNTKVNSIKLGAYWNLFQADSALGDFSKMENLYEYTKLKDEFYSQTRNKLVEELTIRYQTLQKQKDLEVYKARNLLQTQQAVTTRRFTLIGLFILVFTIIAILLRYRGKQKSNRELQLQKDEVIKKNAQLEHVISEKDELLVSKEWLLKEVHHRVKNNLQLVMSLLNSQTTYLKDETALNAVMESRHRVQAMSLIHQKLYTSDNVSNINMKDYIKELVVYLKDSFKTGLSIYFNLEIESIEMDVIQAIPVGLIVNELVTNAIKYAFPYSEEDRITISFYTSSTDEVSLIVADNGRGLPVDFNVFTTRTFGMKLIKGLTDDLGGKLKIDSETGTCVSLVFKTTEFYHGEQEPAKAENAL